MAGLAAARARGQMSGRPRKMDRSTPTMAMAAMPDGKAVAADVAMRLGLTTTTLYVYVKATPTAESRERLDRHDTRRRHHALAVSRRVPSGAPLGRRVRAFATVPERCLPSSSA
jgi:hypothetical protein